MSYDERPNGRGMKEPRELEADVGVISNADGSAYFKSGGTEAYAAVYGPRELHPRYLQNPKRGIIRCKYNMMPFSGVGDRVRPGPSRRDKEINLVIEKALESVVDLSDSPNSVVDVFIELPQTDAGSRCAALTAASMALADAGIKMHDMISSIAVGRVDDQLLIDLEYAEEDKDDHADIPTAMLHDSKEISLLQLDGEMSQEQLNEALELAKEANEKVAEVQKQALQQKYSTAEEEE